MTYVRTAARTSRRYRYLLLAVFVVCLAATAALIGGTSSTKNAFAVTTVDSCGYPFANTTAFPRAATTFSESTVLKGFDPSGGGIIGTNVVAYYSDEHALTIGGPGADWSGTQATAPPGSIGKNSFSDPSPNLGPQSSPTGTDINGRPLSPLLYITQISSTGAAHAPQSGDWQAGANHTFTTSVAPTAIYGAYKPSPTSTFKNDPPKNAGNLGTFGNWTTLTSAINNGVALKDEGFTAAIVYDTSTLGLTAGNIYKLQFMVHDGDQNQTGGDTGEGCTSVSVPNVTTLASSTNFNSAGVGTISDTATVTGSTGGFVTFSAFGPFPITNPPTLPASNACTAANRVAGPTQVGVTNGSASIGPISVSAAGAYYWTADYRVTQNGSVVASSTCGTDTNELVPVNKRGPELNTDARNPAAGTNGVFRLNSGSATLSDVATLTGGTSDAAGTITFRLYDASQGQTCSSTTVGSGGLLGVSQVTVNTAGGGANNASYNSGSASSGSFVVTSGGTYHWTAIYNSSDQKNTDASDPATNFGSTCASDSSANHENPLVINPSIKVTKTPHNQTGPSGYTANWLITVQNTGDTVLTGVNVTETTTNGFPTDCARTATQIAGLPTSIANPSPPPATLTGGNGTSTLAVGETINYLCHTDNVTQAFDNVVVACGTATDNGQVCDNSNATLTDRTGHSGVSDLHTTQTILPNDSATLTGVTATAGTKVQFALYGPNDTTCSGASVYHEDVNVSGPGTYSTTNTATTVSAAGEYDWKIVYSGDSNNQDIIRACGFEKFTITNG